jgi:hypothetical protein
MFRFSIRELMLVTVVVVFGLGWFIEHRRANREAASAAEAREFGRDQQQVRMNDLESIKGQLRKHGLSLDWVFPTGVTVVSVEK